MYIAKKPCSFAGRDFLIGDPVPEELVLKSRVPNLIKTGVLEEITVEAQEGVVKFTIPVHAVEGDLSLELNNEEMVQVFDVLQASVEDARIVIDGITSNDFLILLDVADSRKAVKKLVKDRANVLFPSEEAEV